MELRNLISFGNGSRRSCADVPLRAECGVWRSESYAPHAMPRILSEDVGAPELRTAHAMAATKRRRSGRA